MKTSNITPYLSSSCRKILHSLHKLYFNSFILLFFERSSLFLQDLIESAKSICESKADFWLHGNFCTFDCRCLRKGFRKLKIVRNSHLFCIAFLDSLLRFHKKRLKVCSRGPKIAIFLLFINLISPFT